MSSLGSLFIRRYGHTRAEDVQNRHEIAVFEGKKKVKVTEHEKQFAQRFPDHLFEAEAEQECSKCGSFAPQELCCKVCEIRIWNTGMANERRAQSLRFRRAEASQSGLCIICQKKKKAAGAQKCPSCIARSSKRTRKTSRVPFPDHFFNPPLVSHCPFCGNPSPEGLRCEICERNAYSGGTYTRAKQMIRFTEYAKKHEMSYP